MQDIGFRRRSDVADTEEAYSEYEEAFGCRAISVAGINTALLQEHNSKPKINALNNFVHTCMEE